ncbi:uncharacterized protein LOC120253492 [Dioscorea cayenensis subsp. rotundata]|uniref:Uncharacterized protein LOC120253492 n=1 Tax=Dioscorea cayennensis subsp. rotundata TaxID=55577 RepID=A0AB40ARY5_DIOCR|nr:uncharacterized protein LOC120253492 [Dioscorea cayenensis subsp. rotundata]
MALIFWFYEVTGNGKKIHFGRTPRILCYGVGSYKKQAAVSALIDSLEGKKFVPLMADRESEIELIGCGKVQRNNSLMVLETSDAMKAPKYVRTRRRKLDGEMKGEPSQTKGQHSRQSDVFVLMLLDSLKKSPHEFDRPATICRPMALALSQQKHSVDGLDKMMSPALEDYGRVKLVLMPVA